MATNPYTGFALKRALLQFLTGKALSALLTFGTLLWLVRLMPVAEYGAYVTVMAASELGLAVSTLGLPWLANRLLPDVRLNGQASDIRAVVGQLLLWSGAAGLAVALLFALLVPSYTEWSGLITQRHAVWSAVALLFLEGMGRFVRDSVLGALMLQAEGRASLVLRQLTLLLGLAVATQGMPATASLAIGIEAVSAALSLLLALLLLNRCLKKMAVPNSDRPAWQAPTVAQQWRWALHMYAAQILSLAFTPQLLLNLLQAQAGTSAAAVFGFVRQLYEQISRYLPATLLFGVVRPRLVAAYVGQSGLAGLAAGANLAGKLSLFVLAPVLAWGVVAGDSIVSALSGGKFTDAGMVFLGFLLALVPFSQRQLLETVAATVGCTARCIHAALAGLIVPPFAWWWMQRGGGGWAAIWGLMLGQALFCAVLLRGLRSEVGYSADFAGAIRLLACAGLAALATWWPAQLLFAHLTGVLAVLICGGVVGLAFLVLASVLRPFTDSERDRINSFIGRRLFIW